MRGLIVNADDYAMHDGIDDAILDLAGRGIVTATSVMVLSSRLKASASRLNGVTVDKGLHLDFTSAFASREAIAIPLPQLIARASLGVLDRVAIRTAIERQLDLFEQAFRQKPDFVDGHQHVHHLPVIGRELLGALVARYGAPLDPVGMRLCKPKRWRGVKAAIIAATVAPRFVRRAGNAELCLNSDFAGVYDFAPSADLLALWGRWLSSLQGDSPVVMCHPAAHDFGSDPIGAARLREFAFLRSGQFADLLLGYGITPAPWTKP